MEVQASEFQRQQAQHEQLAVKEAVSWILSASSPISDTSSAVIASDAGTLIPGHTSGDSLAIIAPRHRQCSVGLDIGGTLCKVVKWETGSVGTEKRWTGGGVSGDASGCTKWGPPERPLLDVHSHAPIETLCFSCTCGRPCHCTDTVSTTTSSSSSSSTCSASTESTESSDILDSTRMHPTSSYLNHATHADEGELECLAGSSGACNCSIVPGTLRFTRFETWRIPELLAALANEEAQMKESSLAPGAGILQHHRAIVGITGGGARRFEKQLSALTYIDLRRADELSSLVRGIDLLARVAPQDCFEYPGVTGLRGGVIQRPYSSPIDSPCSSNSGGGEGEGAGVGAPGGGEEEPIVLGKGLSEGSLHEFSESSGCELNSCAEGELLGENVLVDEMATEEQLLVDETEREAGRLEGTKRASVAAAGVKGALEINVEMKDEHTENGVGAEESEEELKEEEDDAEVSEGLQYPYLVVNIGSGVSILRVDAPGEFERVGGSSLGGSTFLGLTMALTGCSSFQEALQLASKGDSSLVDMLVGDIYGGDYLEMNLKATTVASSFGKLVQSRTNPEQQEHQRKLQQGPQHLAKAALLMITNNVGSLAMLHARPAGVRHILFSGSFLHGNKLAMRSLAAAVDFWSKGAMRALFFRHEGHAGALGSMVSSMPGRGH